jgi:diguanylate cyclase (GGDEF)-like protein
MSSKTSPNHARMVRLCKGQQMEQSVLHLDDEEVKFTASFGVAQMSPACKSLEELVAEADGAMYRAKQRGRNCVFVVTTPTPQDAPL